MNLTHRPITPKTGKPKRNKAHMAKVAQLDCVICGARRRKKKAPLRELYSATHDILRLEVGRG